MGNSYLEDTGLIARFVALVGPKDERGCRPWLGRIDPEGYGRMSHRSRLHLAHRLAWELENFRLIPRGMLGCHTCDRRNCVEASHIFIGTIADNNRDAMQKRRHTHGVRARSAKLNDDRVAEIVQRLAMGEPRPSLATEFGVHKTAIDQIAWGNTWKHIPRPEGMRRANP